MLNESFLLYLSPWAANARSLQMVLFASFLGAELLSITGQQRGRSMCRDLVQRQKHSSKYVDLSTLKLRCLTLLEWSEFESTTLLLEQALQIIALNQRPQNWYFIDHLWFLHIRNAELPEIKLDFYSWDLYDINHEQRHRIGDYLNARAAES